MPDKEINPVIITDIARDADLPAILALQRANHRSVAEGNADGFVTVVHTLEILEAMNALIPHVISKSGEGELAGYALSMARECRSLLPILEPMFARLDRRTDLGRYYVMGQVCVAERFRGTGVFDALYREHQARFADRFASLVTEISIRNTRSLAAHARAGFVELERYDDDTDAWVVVSLALSRTVGRSAPRTP